MGGAGESDHVSKAGTVSPPCSIISMLGQRKTPQDKQDTSTYSRLWGLKYLTSNTGRIQLGCAFQRLAVPVRLGGVAAHPRSCSE